MVRSMKLAHWMDNMMEGLTAILQNQRQGLWTRLVARELEWRGYSNITLA